MMKMKKMKSINQCASQATIWLIAIAMAFPLMALAQGSRVVPPKNRYKVSDDVQLGRQAVAQVERQLPTLPENSD